MNQLFRGETFTVHFINNLLFGDLGIKYLRLLLKPIFDLMQKSQKPISFAREATTQEEIFLFDSEIHSFVTLSYLSLFFNATSFNNLEQESNPADALEGNSSSSTIPCFIGLIKTGQIYLKKIKDNTKEFSGFPSSNVF